MLNILNSFYTELYLSQHIHLPTHKDGNVLDLIFTNNKDLIHIYNVYRRYSAYHITASYSVPHYIKCIIEAPHQNCPKNSRFDTLNFFSEDINWNLINEKFNDYDWLREFRGESPDEMLNKFYNICYEICCVSARTSRKSSRNKTFRENLTRRRRRIKKSLLKITSPSRINKLQKELLRLKKLSKNRTKILPKFKNIKLFYQLKEILNIFYSYAKKFSKIKTNIGPLINNNGNFISEPTEMAELLSKQYSSVFSTPTCEPDINDNMEFTSGNPTYLKFILRRKILYQL